ncbi:MAG: hypothetical protein Phog2KO_27010 [Phototrophicaceae bacterium]
MTQLNISEEAWLKLNALAEQANLSVDDMVDRLYEDRQKKQPSSLFHAIFKTAKQAILVIDTDSNYIDANPMACELLGYSHDELLTLNALDILAEEELRHDSILERFHALGYTESIYRIRRKDGKIIYAEFSSVANVIEGVHVAFVRDATDYIGNVTNLSEYKSYIQAIYNDANIPLFSVNVSVEGVFTFHEVSKTHLKVLKKTRAEIIGKPIDQIETIGAITENDIKRLLKKYKHCYNLGKPISYEEQLSINGRTIMWKTYLTPLRDETGRIYRLVGASYDLSDKLAYEREQLQTELLNLELAKAQELSVYKAQVTSMLAHEFQTPLSVINTSIYLLRNNISSMKPNTIEERLERIDRQVTLLHSLMERMISLNYGAVMQQDLDLVALDVPKFVQNIFDDLAMSFPESAPIDFSYLLDEPIILTDKELMRQIITNLSSNAMKYTPNKTPVKVTFAINEAHFNIIVSDRGIGIPEKELETIFNFFQRGTNVSKRQGIGVGLMVVQQAVHRLGGKINIVSQEGGGTTVTVSLSAKAIQRQL